MGLIQFTDKGLFCTKGGFYIDPWRPVDHAIITHGHSDHAKGGSKNYLCHTYSKPILQHRLGEANYQTVVWDQKLTINGVTVSLHPAGHVIGSSQVRVEYKGEVYVFSGDYKTEDDGISGAFAPVRCHTFITESTFGLPIYKWKPQQHIYNDMQQWILQNKQEGKASVLLAYSLGKAQRILGAISQVTDEIYVHGAIYNMQEVLLAHQLHHVKVIRISNELPKEKYRNAVIVAPPGADGTSWMKKFTPYRTAICSGWMQVRGNQRRRNADKGFVLSDHCDFEGLLSSIKATGCEKAFVTHGFQSVFTKYLNEIGIDASEVKTAYGNEAEEETEKEADQLNHPSS